MSVYPSLTIVSYEELNFCYVMDFTNLHCKTTRFIVHFYSISYNPISIEILTTKYYFNTTTYYFSYMYKNIRHQITESVFNPNVKMWGFRPKITNIFMGTQTWVSWYDVNNPYMVTELTNFPWRKQLITESLATLTMFAKHWLWCFWKLSFTLNSTVFSTRSSFTTLLYHCQYQVFIIGSVFWQCKIWSWWAKYREMVVLICHPCREVTLTCCFIKDTSKPLI